MAVWLLSPCYVMLEDKSAKSSLCMRLPVPFSMEPGQETLVVIKPAFHGNRIFFTCHPIQMDCQLDLWIKHVLKPAGIDYHAIVDSCQKFTHVPAAINCTETPCNYTTKV